jgi:TonB family protein
MHHFTLKTIFTFIACFIATIAYAQKSKKVYYDVGISVVEDEQKAEYVTDLYAAERVNDTTYIATLYSYNDDTLRCSKATFYDQKLSILHGDFTQFNAKTRQLHLAGKYKKGEPEGLWNWNITDSTYHICTFRNGKIEGEKIIYYTKTNKIARKMQYSEGKIQGNADYFDSKGNCIKILNYNKGQLDGAYELKYPNTLKTKDIGQYKDSLMVGEWLFYYENGQISAKETYTLGNLTDYKLFDINGNPEQNNDYKAIINPQFADEGDTGLMRYLTNNIKYPKKCRKESIEGKVYMAFIIEEDGKISNVKVLRSPHPLFSAASIRIVSAMPKWLPGKHHNRPVKVQYTLPIVFKLE